MRSDAMGRVVVKARVQNLNDLFKAREGQLKENEVREIKVEDALLDSGATMLSLPRRLIKQLGLKKVRTRSIRTAAGPAKMNIYDAVRLTIQGRDCTIDVGELPNDCPALIGQVPLELMDFVVDPKGQKLIGNPEHGGEHVIDMF